MQYYERLKESRIDTDITQQKAAEILETNKFFSKIKKIDKK